MKCDLSILIPAIRVHKWYNLYNSLLNSCKKYTFELVLIGPFDLPPEMTGIKNVKFIKDFGCPTRAAQLGVSHCEGNFLYHCVDDALFFENAIDESLFFYEKNCSAKDVINMRYRESSNYTGVELPEEFWYAHFHEELRLPGINSSWKISLHHLMSLDYFKYLGGWDCQFEYLNHPLHDLMFRVQYDGGILYNSPIEATTCDHYPGTSGDHKPIHESQLYHDAPIFKTIYNDVNAVNKRVIIPLDNWKQCPDIWERRFKNKKPHSYYELEFI